MSTIVKKQLTSRFGRGGKKPDLLPGANPKSTLHNTSSINNSPSIAPLKPSRLDLDGKRPQAYLDVRPR